MGCWLSALAPPPPPGFSLVRLNGHCIPAIGLLATSVVLVLYRKPDSCTIVIETSGSVTFVAFTLSALESRLTLAFLVRMEHSLSTLS